MAKRMRKPIWVAESIAVYLFHYMVEDLIKLLFSLIIGSLTSPDEASLESLGLTPGNSIQC